MPGPRLFRKRTLLGVLRAAHVRPLPGGCMAKGESHPHLYAVRAQIFLQIVDFHLLRVENRRGQPSVHGRVIAEQFKEILFFARAAGGNDGHGTAGSHGVQQLQIKAILDACLLYTSDAADERSIVYYCWHPLTITQNSTRLHAPKLSTHKDSRR